MEVEQDAQVEQAAQVIVRRTMRRRRRRRRVHHRGRPAVGHLQVS
jgi:hypothetical protein